MFGLATGLLGIFFLLLPIIGSGGSSAWAQASPGTSISQQRIHELEERVKILELERETLDRQVKLEAEHTGRTIEELEVRIRAVEDTRGSEAAAVHTGIRRVKAGYEDTTKTCDAPEAIDARGVWKLRPECVRAAASQQGICDTPYVINADGIKQFKLECL
jgi:hypothetical protein